jgi:transposase-like protein
MEAITTELVNTGEKRDSRGRRLAREEERAALLAAYEVSGLTQREFAEREGIKFHCFTGWLKRHRRKHGKATFAEVGAVAARASGPVEVVLPSGVIVRGADVEQVVMLVERLRRC